MYLLSSAGYIQSFKKTSQVIDKSRQHVRDDVVCAEYKLWLARLAVIHYIGLCL